MTIPDSQQPHYRLGLISKHFAPSEEAGALRWQKLAALSVSHGFDLTVVTRAFEELAQRDDRRLADLPESVDVIQVPTPKIRLHSVESALIRVRKMLRGAGYAQGSVATGTGTPRTSAVAASISRDEARAPYRSKADLVRAYHAMSLRAAESAWGTAAVAAMRASSSPDIIVSCGPPHQVHVATSKLAWRLRVPHVVDMRDPWSLVERVPAAFGSSVLWTMAERDEAAVFNRASLVVVNTEAHAQRLVEIYPEIAERVVAVLNGFDDDPMPPAEIQQAFTIVYAGTIYLDRDPAELLAPVAQLVAADRLSPEQLSVTFVGSVESSGGSTLDDVAASLGLAGFVRVLGRVPRAEALRVLATADLNVVLPQDSHLAVPSKVYEYLRTPSWLLAIAAPGSATAQTLRGTGADIVAPGDCASVVDVIRRRMRNRAVSGRPQPLAVAAEHLSRQSQGQRLFSALRRVLAERIAPSG